MKAILKFKLPKEKHEHHQAMNGWRYAETLSEIWNKFRELDKYGDRDNIPIEEVRQIVSDIFDENGVKFDEL
jgi:hypothetical protein